MRRLTAWIGGVAGGIAAYRLLRRPRAAPEPTPAEPDDRAEELRAKLAESKLAEPPSAEPVVEEATAADTAGEIPAESGAEQEPEPESPEDRRRQVHEEGRATLDEMKPDGSNS